VDDLFSLYAYCLNNPINYTDPLGLFYPHDHMSITKSAAKDEDFNEETSMALANANAGSDLPPYDKDRKRHAQAPPCKDSDQDKDNAIKEAEQSKNKDIDAAINALKCCRLKEAIGHLGRALHTVQDIVKHKGIAIDKHLHGSDIPAEDELNEAKNKTQEALKDFDKKADVDDPEIKKKGKLKKMKKAYGRIRCGGIIQRHAYNRLIELSRVIAIVDQVLGKLNEPPKGYSKCSPGGGMYPPFKPLLH
jgi:vacuolar-type H+-ATPase subunit H